MKTLAHGTALIETDTNRGRIGSGTGCQIILPSSHVSEGKIFSLFLHLNITDGVDLDFQY